MSELRDLLELRIRSQVPDVETNGDAECRLPNTLNLSFGDVDGEALVLNLDLRGIAISTGSACTSGSLDPSHVLVALGKESRWLDAAIRFSIGRATTEAEVEKTEAAADEAGDGSADSEPIGNDVMTALKGLLDDFQVEVAKQINGVGEKVSALNERVESTELLTRKADEALGLSTNASANGDRELKEKSRASGAHIPLIDTGMDRLRSVGK